MVVEDDVSKIIMNTQAHAIADPARAHRDSALLAVTATTYLLLGVAFGVHAAFYLVVASALIALWAAACRRFPVVARLTHAFFFGFVLGLISGLFGTRGGYYGYGYRRYRRRR
jgi:hypothetical protein